MDIIDSLLEGHGKIRGALAFLTVLLDRPSGVGWDDRASTDRKLFARALNRFFAEFKAHEAMEDAYLTRVLRQIDSDSELTGAIAEGHRVVAELTKLFCAVAACGDGEHVYSVRTVFSRLCEELEAHMRYEENVVFPKLRARLPAGLLRELGRRARVVPV